MNSLVEEIIKVTEQHLGRVLVGMHMKYLFTKNEKTNQVHSSEKKTIELGIAHSSKIGNITTIVTIVRTIKPPTL